MLRAFPDATVHTLLYDPDGTFPEFRDARVVTSPLNRIGPLRRNHRLGAAAAGTRRVPDDRRRRRHHRVDQRLGPRLRHPRSQRRLLPQPGPLALPGRRVPRRASPPPDVPRPGSALAPPLRRWDRAAMRAARPLPRQLHRGPRARPRRRTASTPTILFPPSVVQVDGPQEPVGPFDGAFHLRRLAAAALQERRPGRRGVPRPPGRTAAGDRPRPRGGAAAAPCCPPNVAIVSDVSDDQLRWAYAHCVALVAPGLEDLGLTPLEVGAFGKPTLALRGGGYLDTVADGAQRALLRAADRRRHLRGGAAGSGDRLGRRCHRAARRAVQRGAVPRPPRRAPPRTYSPPDASTGGPRRAQHGDHHHPQRRADRRCRRRRRASSPGRPPARVGGSRSPATGRRRSASPSPTGLPATTRASDRRARRRPR